jgi:hypothetical protein
MSENVMLFVSREWERSAAPKLRMSAGGTAADCDRKFSFTFGKVVCFAQSGVFKRRLVVPIIETASSAFGD